MLDLQEDKTHTNQVQSQKSTEETVNVAHKGTQIQVPQQQYFALVG